MRLQNVKKASSLFLAFSLSAAFLLTLPFGASAQMQGQPPAQPEAPPQTQPAPQAQAQPQTEGQPPAQPQNDPSGRVARLNYIQGSISFQPAGTKDWVDANPNRPLTTGDSLWADENSRGELHVDSTAIRVSSQTGLSFLNLNDQTAQIQLPQGSLDIRVRDLTASEAYEIDTPNLAFTILRPGEYRVDVDPNGGSSTVTVRSGNGEVTAAGKSYNLNPGQQYAFSGTDQLTYDGHPAPARSDFETWCATRDTAEDKSQSAQYVSRDVIGYQDLDANGTWRNDPVYGPVWVPSGVAVGWAPYHFGHWVYIAPWGWTWVEDEPWGFAPFHYGRWAVVGGVWGWVPGPVGFRAGVVIGGPIIRPVYAPALVGFVGGGGFSMSIAIGGGAGVAWFPLGPRDVWVPGYRASATYVQNVNITNTRVVNVTQVTNVYNNTTVNRTTAVNNYTYANNVNAVTAVNRNTFVSGQPVANASVKVTADQIQHPQTMPNAPLQPQHSGMVGPENAARTMPPAALANRPVVTKLNPSPRAVPLGYNHPLANTRPGFAASAPQSSQPSHSSGPQGFQSFTPPSHTNPSNGTVPNNGVNPNAVTNPHNGTVPNNGMNPNGVTNPHNGTVPNNGMNPNGVTNPHNGTVPNNGTNPNGSGNQGSGINHNGVTNQATGSSSSPQQPVKSDNSGAPTHPSNEHHKPPKKEKKPDDHKDSDH